MMIPIKFQIIESFSEVTLNILTQLKMTDIFKVSSRFMTFWECGLNAQKGHQECLEI